MSRLAGADAEIGEQVGHQIVGVGRAFAARREVARQRQVRGAVRERQQQRTQALRLARWKLATRLGRGDGAGQPAPRAAGGFAQLRVVALPTTRAGPPASSCPARAA
jgi:hypothetical protein